MQSSPDPLDKLLDEWSETPEPSPRLTATVWQRIATVDRAPAAGFWETVHAWFDRPAFAAGFVVACALAGVLAAELHISHRQREQSAQLARSYLSLIDPLLDRAAEKPVP